MPLAMSLPLSFDRPEWLWLLLTIPVIVVISTRSLAGLEKRKRILTVVLRSLVIALLAAALARVEYVKRNDNVAVIFVADRSRSIPEKLRTDSQEYIRKVAVKAHRDDRVGVIGFDGDAAVDLMPSRGGADVLEFSMAEQPDRTNIAAGVRMAMAAFPEGFARRIVLVTDGNQNAGDLATEIETATANKVAVDVVPLAYHRDEEMLFDRIVIPPHSSRDTRVPVRLLVKSQRPAKAWLTLYHNDQEVPLADEQRTLTLTGGMRPDPFTVDVELHHGGVHRFDARITPIPESADTLAENNRATGFTFVEEQGRVLLLTAANRDDDIALFDALRREKVDVEIRSVDQYREAVDLLSLQQYSVVMLSNIAADEFNNDQHEALASYVRDFGGGLIMTGGDNGFGAGGWIGKPIEEISPVSFEVKHKKIMPRGALTIIMHSCEIGQGNYWGQQVAIATVNTISSKDYLGIISYSYNPGGVNWDVPLAPAVDKNAIIRTLTNMQNGDMPDFDTAMQLAVRDMMKLPDASQRHIIIISDGDPSPPSSVTIQQMIDNKITCSTVGIGYGGAHVAEKTLIDITLKLGGKPKGCNFHPCRNPNQLPQIFVKEAKTVRRSLIDEQDFRPQLAIPFEQTVLGLAGAQLPPLGGMVLTTPKADALMPIVRGTTEGNDPVLAHWNYEMGKMAVFTSGFWPKWGGDWAGWDRFGKFWAQLVRWAMRQPGSGDFDIRPRLDGGQGKIYIEAVNKDASYLNFLQFRGKLVPPRGDPKELMVVQVGPGQYEATFDANDNGNYLVSMRYSGPEGGQGLITTGLSTPYSAEYREMGANETLLTNVVQKSGGRLLAMDPKLDDVFSRDLPPSVSRQPVWRWVVQWLLLPLFLLDVAARRLASTVALSIYVEVAVFATLCATLYSAHASPWMYVLALVLAEAVGWAIRWRYIVPAIQFFTSGVTALARAGQRSSQSLEQLKDVRERVRDGIVRPGQQPAPRAERRQETAPIPLEPAADPKRRFDVGEKEAAKPARDLTESVGGAVAVDPAEEAARRARPDQKTSPGDLTSRLRKAKQRAQDEMKKDQGPGE
ncbi:MAG: hypothetical protein AMXMBFR13_32410 [Phycisphaerae bacterium]